MWLTGFSLMQWIAVDKIHKDYWFSTRMLTICSAPQIKLYNRTRQNDAQVTGSGYVICADKSRIFMEFHKAVRMLQPYKENSVEMITREIILSYKR